MRPQTGTVVIPMMVPHAFWIDLSDPEVVAAAALHGVVDDGVIDTDHPHFEAVLAILLADPLLPHDVVFDDTYLMSDWSEVAACPDYAVVWRNPLEEIDDDDGV